LESGLGVELVANKHVISFTDRDAIKLNIGYSIDAMKDEIDSLTRKDAVVYCKTKKKMVKIKYSESIVMVCFTAELKRIIPVEIGDPSVFVVVKSVEQRAAIEDASGIVKVRVDGTRNRSIRHDT